MLFILLNLYNELHEITSVTKTFILNMWAQIVLR